jgi:hypothetical protein
MAEIGSYAGESTELFLSTNKVKKIYCIDIWKDFIENNEKQFINMDLIEDIFQKKFADNEKVIKCKGTVSEYKKLITGIDFAYIDINNQYDIIYNNIYTIVNNCNNLIAIAGHDYDDDNVKNAVKNVLGKPDDILLDTSWIKFLNKKYRRNTKLDNIKNYYLKNKFDINYLNEIAI